MKADCDQQGWGSHEQTFESGVPDQYSYLKRPAAAESDSEESFGRGEKDWKA